MKDDILLIHPPVWSAFSTYLSVPLLVGFLKSRGWRAHGLDLNVELFGAVLCASGVATMKAELADEASSGARGASSENRLWMIERARVVAVGLEDRLTEALAAIRDPHSAGRPLERRHEVALRDVVFLIEAVEPELMFGFAAKDIATSRLDWESLKSQALDPDAPLRRRLEPLLQDSLATKPRIGLVGISLTADTQIAATLATAAIVKAHDPSIHVVLGGNLATRLSDKWGLMRHPLYDFVDGIISGEGEVALERLCARLFRDAATHVPGWKRVEDGVVVASEKEAFSLEESVFADFSDIPLQKYLTPKPVLPILSSRSCAWECAFCSIPFASGAFRMRPPSDVVAEMRHQGEKHGATYFSFVDEIMTVRSIRAVSRTIAENSDIDPRWTAETRFSRALTPQTFADAAAAGCRRLNFGLESYNQRVLDLMRKDIQVDTIFPNIRDALEAGLSIHLFVIMAFPTETRAELAQTVEFCELVEEFARRNYTEDALSVGYSRFLLDAHSPVAHRPDSFRIAIDRRDDEDLNLVLDFREIAMSAEEADGLASAQLDEEERSTGDECDGASMFHTFRLTIGDEARLIDFSERDRWPRRDGRFRTWLAYGAWDSWRWSPQTSRELGASLLQRSASSQTRLRLYQCETGAYLELDPDFRLPDASPAESLDDLCRALVREGFVLSDGALFESGETDRAARSGTTRWRASPFHRIGRDRSDDFVLENLANGQKVRGARSLRTFWFDWLHIADSDRRRLGAVPARYTDELVALADAGLAYAERVAPIEAWRAAPQKERIKVPG